MAVFKCKMCGGTIEFEQGATVGVCDSCGSRQTLPRLDDDKKANLYDRANHFRRSNDYDKAMGIYNQILNEDGSDAEAYWSLVLCRYGIEYVEDPATHKRVPTVNRAQFTSIFDDEDYKSALEHADTTQKAIYEEEAAAINEIQKGILAISQKEEPFDVFICYKETDNDGRRTQDSVLANDLYHQLTQEGFKVFFSRITLEDKLGTAYEPYIFAALNSAKVMVVLGTKPEYFNAVWVKNEWSRYLALIRNGAKKMLIPAYRDMDPYDLPEEFSHLQAQDMSKLGFMQDLIRGIKKIMGSDEPKQTVKETVVVNSGNANTEPLLKRAFMFLEDGNWQEADEYCERVLDIDPECAQAYLGKLMAERRISKQDELKNCQNPFEESGNFAKAIRFGSEKLKNELTEYNSQVIDRKKKEEVEYAYQNALNLFEKARTQSEYEEAGEMFLQLQDYKDSKSKVDECHEKGMIAHKNDIYEDALELFRKAKTQNEYERAARMFALLQDYKDSKSKVDECYEKSKNEIYDNAIHLMSQAHYNAAIRIFQRIPGWRDADDNCEKCRKIIEERTQKEKEERLENERRLEAEKIAAENKAARKKKIKIIIIAVIVAIIILPITYFKAVKPIIKHFSDASTYKEAQELYNASDYDGAYVKYSSITYKDSTEIAGKLMYDKQKSELENLDDIKKGDIIKFGAYEQDNNIEDGREEIEWQVLSVKNGKALIISKYVLDNIQFAEKQATWEDSNVRNWLNGEFYNMAFGKAHQDMIIESTISDVDYDENKIVLQDKIFLLSQDEGEKYFPDSKWECETTDYAAIEKGASECWFTRTTRTYVRPYNNIGRAVAVVGSSSGSPAECSIEVRPAMWISIE